MFYHQFTSNNSAGFKTICAIQIVSQCMWNLPRALDMAIFLKWTTFLEPHCKSVLAPSSWKTLCCALFWVCDVWLWLRLVVNINSTARGYRTLACDMLAVYTCSKVWSCHLASRHINHTKITAGFLWMTSEEKLVPSFFLKRYALFASRLAKWNKKWKLEQATNVACEGCFVFTIHKAVI